MKSLLSFCVDHARGVILVLVATVLVGLYSFTRLPVDAVPDISPVQVQVNTLVKGLAPEEVEKQVTFPLETELAGVPGMEEIRSLSKFGLSQITLIFRDGTDLFRARQMISEKIQAATPSLPSDVAPRLAPMVTGLGEIIFYTVDFKAGAQSPDIPNDRSEQLMELKRIHDLLIKPRLRSVPGVAEINTIGGKERQLLVLASPEKLAGAGLSFREIRDVVAENTENAGGGILSLGGEQVNVRANTRVNQPEEVATLAVKTGPGATALRLSEVAEVQTGSSVRVGAATWNGREALLGTVMMLAGENPRVVARNVEAQILEISTSLPPGVEIRILSNRADLVDRTIATVRNNLTEGAVIVVVVLLLLLGNLRAALIVSLSIPLSFLLAVTGMVPSRISGNLMSLGAVDFGLIVDASVVIDRKAHV
jgi:cobalt-zinc-cadmium resistance protein CzcA